MWRDETSCPADRAARGPGTCIAQLTCTCRSKPRFLFERYIISCAYRHTPTSNSVVWRPLGDRARQTREFSCASVLYQIRPAHYSHNGNDGNDQHVLGLLLWVKHLHVWLDRKVPPEVRSRCCWFLFSDNNQTNGFPRNGQQFRSAYKIRLLSHLVNSSSIDFSPIHLVTVHLLYTIRSLRSEIIFQSFRMYSYITALALAGGASARVLPRGQDGCCFQLKASGEQSGMVGQLGDGQNRIGGGYEPATYCINNGGITDSNGRGCILTPPTTQFQCDSGAQPTEGFSISGQGEVEYNGSNTFYACGADKGEYNIYTKPVDGQKDCVEVKLSSSDGKCSSNGGGGSGVSSSAPTSAASTQPSGGKSTAPAEYESKGPSSSAPAASSQPASDKSTAPAGYESQGPSSSAPAASTPPAGEQSTAPAGYESKGPSPSAPAASTPPAGGESTAPAGHKSKGPSSPAPAASTPPAGEQSTAPAGYESMGPSSSAPAASTKPAGGKYTPPAGVGSQKPSAPASNSQTQSVPAGLPSQTHPAVATSQPKPETSMPAVQTSQPKPESSQKMSSVGSVQTSHAPQSTGPAGYSSASSEAASTAKPSGTSSGSACQTSLSGSYQTPHLIVPVSSDQPDTAFGTSYNGQINSTTNTIFNFDIPSDYEGKKCSVIFLFPKKEDLETSNYEYSGSGSLSCSELSDSASQKTTYSNAPSTDKDLGTIDLQPGNSYVVATQDCKVGTQSIELSSKDGLSLNFFQDWNPSPLGLWITAC